jgi:hypothetical protein
MRIKTFYLLPLFLSLIVDNQSLIAENNNLKRVALTSIATGLLIGIATGGLSVDIERNNPSVGIMGMFLAICGPFFATLASIYIDTELLPQNNTSGLVNYILPPYIVIPLFYASWIASHYTINKLIDFKNHLLQGIKNAKGERTEITKEN